MPKRDELLKKIGAAQEKADLIVKSLVNLEVSAESQLTLRLNRKKFLQTRSREGS